MDNFAHGNELIWVTHRGDFGSTLYLRGLSHPHPCPEGRRKIPCPMMAPEPEAIRDPSGESMRPDDDKGVPFVFL